MAAACGQQRWTCRYDVKGVLCGKSFDNDTELLSHYKIHLGQLTQNNNNNGTTNLSSATTTTNVGGKMLKTPKTSPSSSTSSPKLYPQTAISPANAASLYAWQNSQQQMRFHPYMKMPPPPINAAQQQAVMQQQIFYEMAAAMAATTGMPIMGMQNSQATAAAAAALHSQMAHQQAAEKQV